jgi:predicted DNA-binding antitoxin AbrB/MazE fold protein
VVTQIPKANSADVVPWRLQIGILLILHGGAKVVRTIRARFSKGVFEPLEPEVTTALHEGEEVLLTVSTPASGDLADPIAGTAGAWKGLVDGETLKRHIYADRLVTTRPPARL